MCLRWDFFVLWWFTDWFDVPLGGILVVGLLLILLFAGWFKFVCYCGVMVYWLFSWCCCLNLCVCVWIWFIVVLFMLTYVVVVTLGLMCFCWFCLIRFELSFWVLLLIDFVFDCLCCECVVLVVLLIDYLFV